MSLESDPSEPLVLDPVPASYEAAVAELESLVADMEGGRLPLESLLQAYRRGAALMVYCRERLQVVEEQVRRFDGTVFNARRAEL